MFTSIPAADTIIIFVPGWARANLEAEEGMCRQFLKTGIDTCLITKPFHQERKAINTFSGELFISGNVFLTVMNFRQLVAELRLLIHEFRKKYKNICLLGMSSGGFQTALAADVEEVDFYFPVITGAKLGSITWEGKLSRFVKKDVIKKGISEDQLNQVWAIADQEYLGHNCKAKHVKQFISLYDEIVPTKYQYMLWEIYHNPPSYEMQCGHVSVVFYFKRIVQEIADFIAERS
ncbi:abhydrolase domain-containing 18 [Panacibacter ginsenosidivorans]|uniref:Abhydrolase domain-containing 18 n=1 Tax=Panacibacter ginsenosidivorans TaxID=1813871 RepID=A0A5B8VAD0_9BACT|nr:alpha/beta hydrolase family protein [Panacibacter ginsenosidivorans]QEC68312.1 abhydrolase domain-containing 18 [Panacibacter ginsenosidivorans]